MFQKILLLADGQVGLILNGSKRDADNPFSLVSLLGEISLSLHKFVYFMKGLSVWTFLAVDKKQYSHIQVQRPMCEETFKQGCFCVPFGSIFDPSCLFSESLRTKLGPMLQTEQQGPLDWAHIALIV